jgi:hypothetical protein
MFAAGVAPDGTREVTKEASFRDLIKTYPIVVPAAPLAEVV